MSIEFIDIKHAYFHARVRRSVFIITGGGKGGRALRGTGQVHVWVEGFDAELGT